jgi:hypothetical protein
MPPDILEQEERESFMEKVYDFQAKQQIEDGGKVWVIDTRFYMSLNGQRSI